ncbi:MULTISPECIES: GNAT family N-acetyltransferase [Streptosporangium]|uniref:Ribosomal protein S18 acetylase RimI-like enzyme n=1 Tax=Streptosporangium brasiliense TaxID=47480 RepID=A0ABT9RLP9_9ACTN|nr:GNAT family N-acetyltransferase [Streptosporangium brasiliense]MDP9869767.1 ribosomal protein S18 acetylase RimI-like enzyme [Streptosporangium brasiliense]
MRQTRYQQRLYTGPADLRSMQSLTQRLWSPASRWHAGELAWLRLQHIGREPEWRTSLWQAGPEVVAWAWARPPGRLDLHLDPAHPELAGEILRWFDGTPHDGERTVTLLDAETALIDTLREHGYRERAAGPFFIHLRRSLDDLPRPRVPDGYTLRPVRGEDDAEARAAVHRAAFSLPGLPPSRVTADSYLQVMRAWPYRTELDWLVEAPDGTPAAFCLVWLDGHNHCAVLEPVGTAPEHRRLGLAGAATLAALHAARRLGAGSARVCARGDDDYPSARATYQALGFRPYARNVSFVRDH